MNMRIGVISNIKREGSDEAIGIILDWARSTGHEIVASPDLEHLRSDELDIESLQKVAAESDIVVSMGGDGTYLASVRAVGATGTPLLGINLGSLGFLTQLTPEELPTALDAIARGEYRVEERMMLEVSTEGRHRLESPYALNDVVVDNGPISRIIDIDLTVNGEPIVTYRADGLIISTPTGSTAYSLACGGPIMNPAMDGIICTPISPFSLSVRPMIFAASDVLELRVRSEHEVAGLTLDGQVMAPLVDTDVITVRRARFRTRFIVFPGKSFYKVLKKKLHWGIAPSGRGE